MAFLHNLAASGTGIGSVFDWHITHVSALLALGVVVVIADRMKHRVLRILRRLLYIFIRRNGWRALRRGVFDDRSVQKPRGALSSTTTLVLWEDATAPGVLLMSVKNLDGGYRGESFRLRDLKKEQRQANVWRGKLYCFDEEDNERGEISLERKNDVVQLEVKIDAENYSSRLEGRH
jgi:hypothetical protein